MSHYKVGQKNFWLAFSSTSKTIGNTEEFTASGGATFFIKVSENKPYHNIDLKNEPSAHPNEKEVLLLPNFYFEVLKVQKEGERHNIFI
mmetsp:Transcript_1837/g.1758  ORF Transcript_1837/g.1758 Transcript_1837/m.1758 type:complete len:89 (-) Transcript_1837:545-811(-)